MSPIKKTVFLVVVLASNLHAQTVVVNDNLSVYAASGAGFAIDVYQDAAHSDDTAAGFSYDGLHVSLDWFAADEGFDSYVVMPGDALTTAAFQAGTFPTINSLVYQQYPLVPVYVGPGDFFLGISTGQGLQIPEDRTVFGWVHLHPENGVVTMVDNVMSYDSPGIIVGTTTLVPEPEMLIMGGFAIVFAAALHRKRRKLFQAGSDKGLRTVLTPLFLHAAPVQEPVRPAIRSTLLQTQF